MGLPMERLSVRDCAPAPADEEQKRREALHPRWRYFGGFDRWSHRSLEQREIIVATANCVRVSLDEQGRIWWWDRGWGLWMGIGDPAEAHVKAEHDFYVATLDRAVPIAWILTRSSHEGERQAAKEALRRLAERVRAMFLASPTGGIFHCWVGPKGVYHNITTMQWALASVSVPAMSPDILAELGKYEEREFQEFSRLRMEVPPHAIAGSS